LVPDLPTTTRTDLDAGVGMSSENIFSRLEGQLEQEQGEQAPLTMSDILDLPAEQGDLMRQVLRAQKPLTPPEISQALGWEQNATDRVIGDLSLAGMIELTAGCIKVCPMQRNTRTTPGGMWSILNDL
jgi:hypothetical protein